MAADAESAKMQRATTVVALLSEKRLKLANMMASQKISTTRKGTGIAAPASANKSRRVFPISCRVPIALPWRERCLSFFGDSFNISSNNDNAAAVASNGANSPEGEEFSRQIRSAIEATARRIRLRTDSASGPLLR